MKIVNLLNYSRENGTFSISFNNAAYRYLFATIRGVLYKNKGTKILTPVMAHKIQNCLAMFAIIYLLCRNEQHILRYSYFSPIGSKEVIRSYKKCLIDAGLIFVHDKTFATTKNFDGTKDDVDFMTNFYFIIPSYSYAVLKTETFTDDHWDVLNFSNVEQEFFDFLENPAAEDKKKEDLKLVLKKS